MLTFTKEQIKEIAEELDCGFRAFYHKENGELIFVPNTEKHLDMDTDAWDDELNKLEENYLDYREIEAMQSKDSFRVMEDFAGKMNDLKLQEKLFNALNRKHPFREFNFVIDNSGDYRDAWFDFKNKQYFEWVENQLDLLNQP
jgi:Uncharacterised protein family (UPF0158)